MPIGYHNLKRNDSLLKLATRSSTQTSKIKSWSVKYLCYKLQRSRSSSSYFLYFFAMGFINLITWRSNLDSKK